MVASMHMVCSFICALAGAEGLDAMVLPRLGGPAASWEIRQCFFSCGESHTTIMLSTPRDEVAWLFTVSDERKSSGTYLILHRKGHSVNSKSVGTSAVVEAKSLRGNFASLRKHVTSADFVQRHALE
jgi:hypothetical protein